MRKLPVVEEVVIEVAVVIVSSKLPQKPSTVVAVAPAPAPVPVPVPAPAGLLLLGAAAAKLAAVAPTDPAKFVEAAAVAKQE